MKTTPTYDKIRNLAIALQQETGVKKRREVGKRLLNTLSSDDVRRKLAQEATPLQSKENDLSIAASRCRALSQLWTIIIQASMSAAKSISSTGKAKLSIEDVTLPYYLMIQCDKPDGAFENSGLDLQKISGKTVRALVTYCLNMLAHEEASDMAGTRLLQMLNHICSKVEHVASFKYDKTIRDIFSEIVTERLLQYDLEQKDPEMYVLCAKVLDTLLESCRTIGIQLLHILPESVELVSDWCKEKINRSDVKAQSEVMVHLVNVASTLMECHPEHAVGLISRYGRVILSYTKRCYMQSYGLFKHALNRYLLAHLTIAEVAGKHQGFLSGDLGDLGKASFGMKNVTIFLKLVLADTSKIISLGETLGESRVIQRGRNTNKYCWITLDNRQRCHLELGARLLKNAQRHFMVDVFWKQDENTNENLLRYIEQTENNQGRPQSIPINVQLQSPWVDLVLKTLYTQVSNAEMSGIVPNASVDFLSQQSNQGECSEPITDFSSNLILGSLSEQKQKSGFDGPLACLPIICACAEMFPDGECWMSTYRGEWKLPKVQNAIRQDPAYSQQCRPEDLAAIIYLLSKLLAAKGISTSDSDIQAWTIVTLTHLTKVSSLICAQYSTDDKMLGLLQSSWHIVWQTIFRSDLRYSSYTAQPSKDSLGELILMLLTEIVQHNCVEIDGSNNPKHTGATSSWVFDHQAQIWSLPVFSSARLITSTVPLELICTVLNSTGLSEQGVDTIDTSFERKLRSFGSVHLPMNGNRRRRNRLVSHLLGRLHDTLSSTRIHTMEEYLGVLSGTLVSLIHGTKFVRHSAFFTRSATIAARYRTEFEVFHFGCCTTFKRRHVFDSFGNSAIDIFNSLWYPPTKSDVALFSPGEWLGWSRQPSDSESSTTEHLSTEFIPEADSDSLLRLVSEYLEYQSKPTFQYQNGSQSDIDSNLSGNESDPSSLLVRFTIFKILLSISLCGRDEVYRQQIESIKGELSFFFREGAVLLSSGNLAGEELLRILQSLWGLACATSRLRTQLNKSIVDELHSLNKECRSLLEDYSENRRNGQIKIEGDRSLTGTTQGQDAVDWTDDSDGDASRELGNGNGPTEESSDESMNVASKRSHARKRGMPKSDGRGAKRRRVHREQPKLSFTPDLACSKYASLLLLTLQPSLAMSTFICEKLLGYELDIDPTSIGGDVSIQTAIFCAHLLVDRRLVYHNTALKEAAEAADDIPDTLSPVVMVCRVVELLRAGAGPSSNAFQYGYDLCAEMLHLVENVEDLSINDSKAILDIMSSDDAFDFRNDLRAIRTRASSRAFTVKGKSFHQTFDKFFISSIVKASLTDSCANVRKEACLGVGIAIYGGLDETRRFSGILKYAVPLFESNEQQLKMNAFREWYEKMGPESGIEDTNTFEQFLLDSMDAFQYDSISLRSLIIGCTKFTDIYEQCLLDLLLLSSQRLDLTGLCFHAVEKAAAIRNYDGAEDLIKNEVDWILKGWIQAGRQISDLPLLVTGPQILRRFVEGGRLPDSKEPDGEITSETNLRWLSRQTAISFARRYCRAVVPLVTKFAIDNDSSGEPLADHRFQDLVSLLVTEDEIESRSTTLIINHIQDIQGFIVCLANTENPESQTSAMKLTSLLEDHLSKETVAKYTRENANLIIRRILEICSKADALIGSKVSFYDAICSLIATLDSSVKPVGDIFLHTGTSITENFILGIYWLSQTNDPAHKECRWKVLEFVGSVILLQMEQHKYDGIQLGFAIHGFLVAALDSDHYVIQLSALRALQMLLVGAVEAIENQYIRSELISSLRRLVGATFCIHEKAQKSYVSKCWTAMHRRQETLRGSLGLLQSLDEVGQGDAWGWDDNSMTSSSIKTTLKDFGSHVDPNIPAIMIITYDMLELIISKTEHLDVENDAFICAAPPHAISHLEVEALSQANPQFCAQTLVIKFINQTGCHGEMWVSNPKRLCSRFLDGLDNGQYVLRSNANGDSAATMERHSEKGSLEASIDMGERLLHAELVQIRLLLHSQRLGLRTTASLGLFAEDYEALFRGLSQVCGERYPRHLRIAASRCLGEFNLQDLSRSSLASSQGLDITKDWIENAIQCNELIFALAEKMFFVLCECLRSSDAKTSLIASETLHTLLTSQQGCKICSRIKHSETKRILEPFRRSSRQATRLQVPLISSLRESPREILDDDHCWREEMWLCHEVGERYFDIWICQLVPSLILCLFKSTDANSKESSDLTFFAECYKICTAEPLAAKTLFPCILYNLLERRSPTVNFRKKITSAFTVLLGHEGVAGLAPNVHAVELALDFLFLIRRVTQYGFLASRRHKKNLVSLPNKTYGSTRNPKSDDGGSHNEGLDSAPLWKGVPYGIVLGLDGLMVANSCVQAQRYASAIFYAEMYLEASLGMSGGVFQLLSTTFADSSKLCFHQSNSDISGSISKKSNPLSLTSDMATEHAVKAISVLERCYQELGNLEAMQALKIQKSCLAFNQNNLSGLEILDTVSTSIVDLQRLDGRFSTVRSQVSVSMQLSCDLDSFGLNGLQQLYIEGLASRERFGELFSAENKRTLREKWFESTLRLMHWDDVTAESSTPSSSMDTSNIHCPLPVDGSRIGFFESLLDALSCFRNDDTVSCHSLLEMCREQVLECLSSGGGEEKSLNGFLPLADKLQALSDFEHLIAHDNDLEEVFKLWGIKSNVYDLSQNPSLVLVSDAVAERKEFSLSSLSLVLREGLLRTMRSRFQKNISRYSPERELVSHLWQLCTKAREDGIPGIAENALQKLSPLLNKMVDSGGDIVPMEIGTMVKLRLEETRIQESRGDFTSAIRQLKQVINHLQNTFGDNDDAPQHLQCLLADSMIACGRWLTTYKVEQAKDILHTYLQPGADLANSIYEADEEEGNATRATNAFLALAEVAAALYDDVRERVVSSEWIKAGNDITVQRSDLDKCLPMIADCQKRFAKAKRNSASTKEIQKECQELEIYFHTTKRNLERALAERSVLEKSVGEHLILAIEAFISALSNTDTGSDEDMSKHIFRLISLWLSADKRSQTDDKDINRTMSDACESIPSYRFVTLTNQLFARIELPDDSNNDFQNVLQQFVLRMCMDHPYHCLNQLVALSNGKNVGSGVSGRNVKDYLENVGDSKVNAATQLLQKLKKEGSTFIEGLVDSYRMLCDAYIHLAHAPTDSFHKSSTKDIAFSKVCPSKSTDLSLCLGRTKRQRVDYPPCVITSPPPVQPSTNYGDGVDEPIGGERIEGFTETFSVTETGLHRPKIVTCIGSKGTKYRQLVKGEDEIRQDAVMSQIFSYVNNIMARSGSSAKAQTQHSSDPSAQATTTASSTSSSKVQKRLRVFTYNIIPLSPASGVLEWVEDTMPFGEYMIDKRVKGSDGKSYHRPSAHSKYYPGEWSNTLCRLHLTHSPTEDKRASFDEVCKHHSPVFRFFFTERFGHSMQAWHEAKLEYTRSVAVNSIVGHILGIGDRHTSNILVHQKTGEVVHIDFGIVFDQGKLLNMPEKVPFRLTRNVTDGMGPCGTEGTFNIAAQETAKVLRDNANALLTILSAIVADPLYKWNVSPVKAMQMAKDGDDEDEAAALVSGTKKNKKQSSQTKEDHNKAAAQAIAKIHEKLQGYEDGTSGEQQSIEGQVQLLINSARDAENLCTMFPGWAPWI